MSCSWGRPEGCATGSNAFFSRQGDLHVALDHRRQCRRRRQPLAGLPDLGRRGGAKARTRRSEEHTSELQSLMRISYAVFCLKKKKNKKKYTTVTQHQHTIP